MGSNKKLWVSDRINGEELKWRAGDFICINAGTGTGKSHFIRTDLYEQARFEGQKILFISNRDKLKEQNRLGIRGKEDTITIINYQAIESVILRGEPFNFDIFKYVVCDECHYFLTESSFNRNNDLSLNAILKIENSVVIFMTATGSSFFKFIDEEYKERLRFPPYYIPRDYSRIKRLYFYNKDESLEQFINKEIKENEKVLYFCNNVKKLYELRSKYQDSIMVFSDPYKIDENGKLVKKSTGKGKNDKYAKDLDRAAIKEIIETKTLNRRFTFTTTTLDNGVDLFGKDIKWVIIDDIRDFDTLIQCLGRKRFIEDDATDTASVIIRNVNNMVLGSMLTKSSKTLKEVNTFIKDGTEGWIECCDRYSNSDYCLYDTPGKNKYDSEKKVNRAKYQKIKADCSLLKQILTEDREIRDMEEMNGRKGESVAYIRYVSRSLQKANYILIDDIYRKMELSDYLDSVVSKNLYKEDQEQLRVKMNVNHDGKLMKSREVLNSSLQELGLNYTISKPKKDNRRKLDDGTANPKKNKMYWVIYKIE